jgi:carbonic anhydrase/acetyltransferase-like protein (isoleucine patch superfamily)
MIYKGEGAVIIGDVTLGEDVSIWPNAVLRGDQNSITVGDKTNIQDNCTLHEGIDYPLTIGKCVTIGHNAIVHGCTIGDNTLIGMGAIIMNGAKIGNNCLVGAGALVTQNTVVPDGSLAFGNPARVIRPLSDDEIEGNKASAERYLKFAKEILK